MNCIACFDPVVGSAAVRCNNPNCSTVLCVSCIRDRVEMSHREKSITRCVEPSCNSRYYLSNVVAGDLYHKYLETFVLEYQKDKNIISAIKTAISDGEVRKTMVEEKFPKAINRCIALTPVFQKRLNKMNNNFYRDLEIHMKRIRSADQRHCFNESCGGYIKGDKCVVCDTIFCLRCETKYHTGPCDESILKSLEVLRDLISCPKCKVKVMKSKGCNYMHCTNCGTNFDYATGKKSAYGNNHNIDHIKHPLSVELKDKVDSDTLEEIVRLEKRVENGVPDNFRKIIEEVRKYIQTNNIIHGYNISYLLYEEEIKTREYSLDVEALSNIRQKFLT